ncbi:LacI family DNA-binding transcriptional regulator [Streptomyces asiaticus]
MHTVCALVLRGVPGPSERTRQRVLKAAADLGYQADRTASTLASRRSRLLGVMVDIHSPFHAELVEHLHTAAEEVGYDLVLSTLTRTRDERTAVDTLLAFRSEALILLGPTAPADALAVLDNKAPVIVVGRRIADTALDVVRTADDDGVRQTVDHLVGLGHREIVHVDGGKGVIATDRRRGYRTAMRRHGLGDHIRVLAGVLPVTMLFAVNRPLTLMSQRLPLASPWIWTFGGVVPLSCDPTMVRYAWPSPAVGPTVPEVSSRMLTTPPEM